MKVVLLHDWLTGFRGGERVLEALCEIFPDAPIYTLLHKKGSTSPTIESKEIITSFLNKIPGIEKNYRKFLPLMPLAAKSLKITHDCDLVISSSHCVIKGVPKPKGSKHICYIHSPMRYIYDQFDNYFQNSPLPIKISAHIMRPFLKWWDIKSNSNVDLFLPNSKFVNQRILNYYGNKIPSKVVYPFVDLKDFREKRNLYKIKEEFYLMVTAFAPNKRVDIAINAFNDLGLNLKIIGGGSDEEIQGLKRLAKPNIEFLGKLSREEVIKHYFQAKAFIFPGVEDFGITPLEAMASGTKVIAFKQGGVLETLTDKTATFFYSADADALKNAILLNENKMTNDLYSQAELFSKEKFIEELNKSIYF